MTEFSEKPTLDEGASTQAQASESSVLMNDAVDAAPKAEAAKTNKETMTQSGDAGDETQKQLTVELPVIAQALGLEESDLDIDDDGKVVFKTKIDGQIGKAKPKESIATYQKQGHLDGRLREVNQREEAIKAKEAALYQAYQDNVQKFAGLNKAALSEIAKEYQSIDWAALRAHDPAEWAAKRAEFQEKAGKIQNALTWAEKQREESGLVELAEEAKRIPDVLPEWNDPDVREKERADLAKYLTANKMNPKIANYADVLVLLKKAKAFDELNQKKADVTKLVRVAPKTSAPGASSKGNERPKAIEDLFYS